LTPFQLARLERVCAGRGSAQRRDAALIAVFRTIGSACRSWPGSCATLTTWGRSNGDLWQRQITVPGKGRRTRVVKISFAAARSLYRYLCVRARHRQAWRPQLWLGPCNRGPTTASGTYQVTVRHSRQCGTEVSPHRFRHPLQPHQLRDNGGAQGDLISV
jgi:integrase/recombinase XerC